MICAHLMPIYDYKCDNGHRFEAMQSMSDAPIDTCDVCDAPAHRILHAPAVHFKGSGFYTTDYARKKGSGSKGGSTSETSTPAASTESKDTAPAKPAGETSTKSSS